MDFLSGPEPICYSTMEADELDNFSGEEVASEYESAEEDVGPANVGLCDRYIRPRFERWLEEAAPTSDQGTILRQIFSHLTVTSRNVEVISSERRLSLDFELYGILGRYRQTSQADSASPVWDVSKGAFNLKANVEAELALDGETLIDCAHFATDALRAGNDKEDGGGPGRSRSSINQDRLSEHFGSETVVNLGGFSMLMQLFGVICADPVATCYAEVLPFGLLVEVVGVSEATEEPKPQAPKKKVQTGYPLAAAADAAPAGPPVAVAVQPTKPPTSNTGPPRPVARTGKSAASPRGKESASVPAAPKGSSAAPKARQSSHGRKPAPAPR